MHVGSTNFTRRHDVGLTTATTLYEVCMVVVVAELSKELVSKHLDGIF